MQMFFYEMNSDNFVTKEGCAKYDGRPINHGIVITGYGTDPTYGPYWIIKNSWGANWGDNGFVRIARDVNCASICNLYMYTYGDPASYFESTSFLN